MGVDLPCNVSSWSVRTAGGNSEMRRGSFGPQPTLFWSYQGLSLRLCETKRGLRFCLMLKFIRLLLVQWYYDLSAPVQREETAPSRLLSSISLGKPSTRWQRCSSDPLMERESFFGTLFGLRHTGRARPLTSPQPVL